MPAPSPSAAPNLAALTEVEIRFTVPPARREALRAALARGRCERIDLVAQYLDTPDRALARAGLALRLRRENGRWVQTLKAPGANAMSRFEHAVERPDGQPDWQAHAGTPAGERLQAVLAAAGGGGPALRYGTEIQRTVRRVRGAGGVVVELAFDEGRIVAGGRELPVCELEFEAVSGPVEALVAMAARWVRRHGLVYEPRSKAERGDRLADGAAPGAAVCKAGAVAFPPRLAPSRALAAFVDAALEPVARNAGVLTEGAPDTGADALHQLRVALRRLRSVQRALRGLDLPAPPAGWEARLRAVFAQGGALRDAHVLAGGAAAELAPRLAAAGLPPLAFAAEAPAAAELAALGGGSALQTALLEGLGWVAALSASAPASPSATPPLADALARRLGRWHRRIAADAEAFATLDEEAIHALRKRIKRQRYVLEAAAALVRAGAAGRYRRRLLAAQEALGTLNDLFGAQARCLQALRDGPPGDRAAGASAAFAAGWLAARIDRERDRVAPLLARLASARPPKAVRAAGD